MFQTTNQKAFHQKLHSTWRFYCSIFLNLGMTWNDYIYILYMYQLHPHISFLGNRCLEHVYFFYDITAGCAICWSTCEIWGVPSSNQTWQWEIPYRWMFIAGKIFYKWWMFNSNAWLLEATSHKMCIYICIYYGFFIIGDLQSHRFQ